MPASAGRVEASVEDAQTGVRSGFVSRVTNDGAPAGSQTQHVVMVGRRAGRSASVARGIAEHDRSECAPHPPAPQPEFPRRVGAPRGAPLCQDEDPRGSSGPVGGWPPFPAVCGPDGGEGGARFALGRSMVQGPALLGALRATTHLPCVWAAGRRAAAVGSAKSYGDLRRTPRLATVERPRE